MRHLSIVAAAMLLVCASVWLAAAQSGDEPRGSAVASEKAPPAPAGTAPAATGRAESGQKSGQRAARPTGTALAEQFDQQIREDVEWLRKNELGRYADKMGELRDGDQPRKRQLLWREHLRVQMLRRAMTERPEEGRLIVEQMRMEIQIRELAKQIRAAKDDQQADLKAKLEELLQKQFDAKLNVQQTIMDNIKRRMEKLEQEMAKQKSLRNEIISQRHSELADPSKPLPELLIAPPEGPREGPGGPGSPGPGPDGPGGSSGPGPGPDGHGGPGGIEGAGGRPPAGPPL